MLSSEIDRTSYLTTCEEDEEGNLILSFPDELLEAMGWGEGTLLDISAEEGQIVLRHVSTTVVKQDYGLGGGEPEVEGGDSY